MDAKQASTFGASEINATREIFHIKLDRIIYVMCVRWMERRNQNEYKCAIRALGFYISNRNGIRCSG